MYTITVHSHNDIDEVVVYGEKSLLLELEERNILPKYSCRQGHCGICIARLLKGEVTSSDVLYPLENNEILLCSTKPNSDLTIDLE
jgi:ferredoxin